MIWNISFSPHEGDNYNKYIKCKLTERRSIPAESRLGTTAARSWLQGTQIFNKIYPQDLIIDFFFLISHGNGSLWNKITHIKLSYLRRPFGKGRFIIRQRSHTRPCIFIWSTQDPSFKKIKIQKQKRDRQTETRKYNNIHASLEEKSCSNFFQDFFICLTT